MAHAFENVSKLQALPLLPRLLFEIVGHALHLADAAQLFKRLVGLNVLGCGHLGFFFTDPAQPPHQGIAEHRPIASILVDEANQTLMAFLQGILPPFKLAELPLRQAMELSLHCQDALYGAKTISH
jgi:hypothetical protein